MKLTKTNLEKNGYMFSASLGLMVREHEAGNGKWDIEVDGYRRVISETYEPDTDIFSAYDTFAEMVTAQPELIAAVDWIHGDKVEMW